MNKKQILKNMQGKMVEIVETHVSGSGDVLGVVFYMVDGSKIDITPSSYSYGQQELIVSE